MSGVKRGVNAMQQLAERLEWVGNSLSEFRQEAKERFQEVKERLDRVEERLQEHGERLARLEADVAALKSKSGNANGWMKHVWNLVSALIGALLALAGIRIAKV